jgi:polyhydroxyalkanoate synthesis regulator phasin
MKFRMGLIAGLGIAGAIVAGTLLTASFVGAQDGAATPTPSAEATPEAQRRLDAFLQKVADRLGVSVDSLKQAFKDAAKETIDELVAQGELDPDKAENLKARIDEGDGLFPFGRFGPKFGGWFAHPRIAFGVLDSAADAIGITRGELMDELRDGKSLAQVAQEHNVSVDDLKNAMLQDAKAKLDEAVANGDLTQERADSIYAKFQERIDDLVNRTWPDRIGPPFGHGRGWGPF